MHCLPSTAHSPNLFTKRTNQVIVYTITPIYCSHPASDKPEESTEDDTQYVSELLDKPDTDDESSSSDESEVDLDGYITIDDESDSDDEIPLIKRNQNHHNNLHPELWFNVKDEVNPKLSFQPHC